MAAASASASGDGGGSRRCGCVGVGDGLLQVAVPADLRGLLLRLADHLRLADRHDVRRRDGARGHHRRRGLASASDRRCHAGAADRARASASASRRYGPRRGRTARGRGAGKRSAVRPARGRVRQIPGPRTAAAPERNYGTRSRRRRRASRGGSARPRRAEGFRRHRLGRPRQSGAWPANRAVTCAACGAPRSTRRPCQPPRPAPTPASNLRGPWRQSAASPRARRRRQHRPGSTRVPSRPQADRI